MEKNNNIFKEKKCLTDRPTAEEILKKVFLMGMQ